MGMHTFDATSLLDETLQSKAESMRDLLLNVPLGKMNRGTALTVRRLMEEYHDRVSELVESQVTTRKALDNGSEILKTLKDTRDELARNREEQILKIEDFYILGSVRFGDSHITGHRRRNLVGPTI